MASWDVLREPIRIGGLTVKNRVAAAPTLSQWANADQSVNQDLVEFYRAQAKGGAGLITVTEAAVDEDRAITHFYVDKLEPGGEYTVVLTAPGWCCSAPRRRDATRGRSVYE